MMTTPIFGATAQPDECRLYTLRNASGMAVTISERGAALRSWHAPDRYGRMADVVLAEPDHASSASPAARWQGRHAEGGVSLLLTAPGGAELLVNYHLDDDGSLIINYKATAAAPVALDVQLRPYFNLNGGHADVGDHMLQIDAAYFVEVDAGGAPAGVAAVGGTPFDFRQPAPIGPRLRWSGTQTRLMGGFNHCLFVRDHYAGGQGALREVARVVDPGSGRRLQMYTTEAALQLCTGQRAGFCLEAHARPCLMSAAWPQVVLRRGQVYRQTTVYRLALEA
ncbi:aldose epimerase family protein [Massilia pseudoviolaceinigra]|uniref:aldose epimerase family protein n=1 Tax=Massilia pseudoviolaceinigra TaxID=3057165 RepID=UPI002796D618|nr:galactose-1-epimerase [Massilia sp. CCM 9206]MDQ1919202.1 galactose-1-epimerase [Massilia sp. CCM 9206]